MANVSLVRSFSAFCFLIVNVCNKVCCSCKHDGQFTHLMANHDQLPHVVCLAGLSIYSPISSQRLLEFWTCTCMTLKIINLAEFFHGIKQCFHAKFFAWQPLQYSMTLQYPSVKIGVLSDKAIYFSAPKIWLFLTFYEHIELRGFPGMDSPASFFKW